jgi:hypothetical protein
MLAVLIFGAVFMVGFGIWHAPLLEFASEALPNLAETMTMISTNSTGISGTPEVLSPISSSFLLEYAAGTNTD